MVDVMFVPLLLRQERWDWPMLMVLQRPFSHRLRLDSD